MISSPRKSLIPLSKEVPHEIKNHSPPADRIVVCVGDSGLPCMDTDTAIWYGKRTVCRCACQENIRQWVDGANDIRLCIVCGDGGVYVEQSGCPDKICVHKGRITTVGDMIVCLPAQTVVEVIQP